MDPRRDRPVQFAAIRTDQDFNVIGRPIELFSQISPDYLPAAEACLVTGITPQIAQQRGLPEAEFMRKVNAAMSEPGTCTIGYNSIRFDDEVTRHSLYRNLIEPYGREWQNGNSRWDIIDLVRTCHALRPEGIEWPKNEQGNVSFKLELLTVANDLAHENAHDAVSDVYATIAMAKLIKEKQPKLFDFLYQNRSKQRVESMLVDAMTDAKGPQPVMHISGRISPVQGCGAWVVPVFRDPKQKTKFLTINLTMDLEPLLELSAEQFAERLYAKRELLEQQGLKPLPIKWIQSNKCPVVAPAKTLRPEDAERIGIDRDECLVQLKLLQQHSAAIIEKIELWHHIESQREMPPQDADTALYDGFIGDADKKVMEHIHTLEPTQLSGIHNAFNDARLNTLLFRYKARNYPHTLDYDEQQKWMAFCKQRVTESGQGWQTLTEFEQRIEKLGQVHADNSRNMRILKQCVDYVRATYG
ncbi:exodeoxyribonuclease I [Echinimonas agarilytica]|uniref:Exodeoxyribonuclease I n=1 Tax=Echinimonas agarilytica TaxID=1215918 RepID=A0AA42B7X1_9GAMM|nr:exodeoxyribonuclease I [Echinimonas agarilytica]